MIFISCPFFIFYLRLTVNRSVRVVSYQPAVLSSALKMHQPTQAGAQELDAAFVGVLMDIGVSHRSDATLGSRQIGDESRMIQPYKVGIP